MKARNDKNFMKNALKKNNLGRGQGIIASGLGRKAPSKSKLKKQKIKRRKDPCEEVADKYLNDPLVLEIIEKYKDEEKQIGFEF